MRLHAIQHVPFENLARIETWARGKRHTISKNLMFDGGRLPTMGEFDWLVILGGPMNIYEEKKYPWLVREKKFIQRAIKGGKIILGICLGAQLLADVLGAKVSRNREKEIGWYPVTLTEEGERSPVFGGLPRGFTPFHWHGDMFEIPNGAARTVQSEGCFNQAFEYEGRVIGLQFHLESTTESIKKLVRHCQNEIQSGKHVQSADEMLSQPQALDELGILMTRFLNAMESQFVGDGCTERNKEFKR